MQNKQIIFNDNETGAIDNNKIFTLDRIHNNHADKNSRTYKLHGIYRTLMSISTSTITQQCWYPSCPSVSIA